MAAEAVEEKRASRGYTLPIGMHRRIRHAAADLGVRPCVVVERCVAAALPQLERETPRKAS